MGVGGRANRHSLNCRVRQHLVVIGDSFRDVEFRGDLLRGGSGDICHGRQSRAGDARGQIFRVDAANAAAADDCDVQNSVHNTISGRARLSSRRPSRNQSGARTFLSAATSNVIKALERSDPVEHSGAAADKNVRAPMASPKSSRFAQTFAYSNLGPRSRTQKLPNERELQIEN